MLSLVAALRRQSLIAQRNAVRGEMLSNASAQRHAAQNPNLSFGSAQAIDNYYSLANIDNSTQLMALNAELNALNSYSSSSLNYLV